MGELRLDFRLHRIDLSDFDHWTDPKTGEVLVRTWYEVQLIFDGPRLTYRLIIPQRGRWNGWQGEPQLKLDDHWGTSFHIREATRTNLAAAFDVSGYGAKASRPRPSPQPSRTSTEAQRRSTTASSISRSLGHSGRASLLENLRKDVAFSSSRRTSTDSWPINPNSQLVSTNRYSNQPEKPERNPPQQQVKCRRCGQSKTREPCDRVPGANGKNCSRCSRLHIRCRL